MATGTMATAAGAALVLYFLLIRRIAGKVGADTAGSDDDRSADESKTDRSLRRKLSRRPAQAPATWFETISTLSETLRFTYSETLAKWPIGDLAFGINYLMRRQGYLQVATVYTGSDCTQLTGPDIVPELKQFLRLLTICMFFSKKPFPVFLELAGYSEDDVLLQEPKAGLLKPAFTILQDHGSKCFLLLIRGTHSIKDTLTAATGAVVPFHLSVLHDGGISNLVLGYAHCGMVAAARWIAKLSSPCLLQALTDNPDYTIKIVGHSLGGGTAALLTYILREQKELCSTTCVTFAPAACMTWELAESGKHFITTIINGSDLVPTFSASSVDDLRSEVTASSWSNDLLDQVERTRVLNVVYRSATAIGSRLPSIASAKARVAGAGAFLRPVSSSTQVVMKRAHNVAQAVARTRPNLSSWSCMGARRRNVGQSLSTKEDSEALISCTASEILVSEEARRDQKINQAIVYSSSTGGEIEEDEEQIVEADKDITTSTMEAETEGELWYQLEKELKKKEEEEGEIRAMEEEAVVAQEVTTEANVLADAVENKKPISSSDILDLESYKFYPPGKIMHVVSLPSEDEGGATSSSVVGCIGEDDHPLQGRVGIYETPRHLYSKIRLARTMINDHYMPMYKKMMEQLIHDLESDESYICETL